MTKSEVVQLRNELNKVLEKFNKTSDIQMSLGNASYGTDVTFKLVGNKKAGTGKVISRESENFKRYCTTDGISPSALHKPFTYQGSTIEFTGYNTRSPKNCYQFSKDGVPYKGSKIAAIRMIRAAAPELLV